MQLYMHMFKWHREKFKFTACKRSIENITNFRSKYISKAAIGMKFSSNVINNPSNPHMQWNQIIDVHKLCVKLRKDTGKTYWFTEMYFILCTKAFVCDHSFLYEEASLFAYCMYMKLHCSGVTLAHSSTQKQSAWDLVMCSILILPAVYAVLVTLGLYGVLIHPFICDSQSSCLTLLPVIVLS